MQVPLRLAAIAAFGLLASGILAAGQTGVLSMVDHIHLARRA